MHCCCDNYRGIPVFCCQALKLIVKIGFQICVGLHGAVVLHYILLTQNSSKNLCILFNNGSIGNDVDHPAQSMGHGVFQGKSKGGYGFSPSGGNGQRVNSPGTGGKIQTLVQDLAPAAVQLGISGKPGLNELGQSVQQNRQRVIAAPGRKISCEKGLCIQIVSIHQTGIEHPGPQGEGERVPECRYRPHLR